MFTHHASSSATRVWSHNTNYAGAVGIHSEDGPSAHARNVLENRRTSDVMTAEEEILKKKMRSLAVSRKSIETSMLSYSQKMKNIAERREQAMKSSPVEKPITLAFTNSSSSNGRNTNGNALSPNGRHSQRVHTRNQSLPFLTEAKSNDSVFGSLFTKCDNKLHEADKISVKSEPRGRVSVDSGFGTESDCYLSDAESVAARPRLASNASRHSDDCVLQESSPSPTGKTNGRRRSQPRTRRFRRAENTELPTVFDTELSAKCDADEDKKDDAISEADETVTISPFPANMHFRDIDELSSRLGSISESDDVYDSLNRTRILNPLSSPRLRWSQNTSPRSKKKSQHILTKPKATHSPSIGSMRFRRYYRRPSKKTSDSKSNRHSFKYSDAVETALRSVNNSPEGRRDPPESPDLPGLDLNELLNEVIQRPFDREILRSDEPEEFKPHRLFRERSFSDPTTKPVTFTSTLDQVREDDESELRSVLRKNPVQYPAEKKSVQFFLPDIFLHANKCTSRPEALR